MNKEEILQNSKYEDAILELIDNQNKFTRSDLQGAVSALVSKIRIETKADWTKTIVTTLNEWAKNQ
jgi:hypothetical protein